MGTIIPLFKVVDLEAADNADRVKYTGILQSPKSLSPGGLLFINDTQNSWRMLVTKEVSQTLDTYEISSSDLV